MSYVAAVLSYHRFAFNISSYPSVYWNWRSNKFNSIFKLLNPLCLAWTVYWLCLNYIIRPLVSQWLIALALCFFLFFKNSARVVRWAIHCLTYWCNWCNYLLGFIHRLSDKTVKEYAVYRSPLLFWGLVDLIYDMFRVWIPKYYLYISLYYPMDGKGNMEFFSFLSSIHS